MNWLERARREISGTPTGSTANSADGNLTAVMAVPHYAPRDNCDRSNGSNGSALSCGTLDSEALPDAFDKGDGEGLPDCNAEARRQRVLAMLAERPGTKYAVVTDADANPDAVILALAIRGAMPDGSTVTGEMRIPRPKYDPFLLLELIERHGGTTH